MAPKVATFDCYGTLVDWEGGVGAFLYALLLREGVEEPPPGRELRKRWEEIQFELVRGRTSRTSEILAETTVAWCRRARHRRTPAIDGPAMVGSIRAWQPFSDTRPALTKAREAGVKLVIISNTDRDIISHTVRQIGVPFDKVIVAEDVGRLQAVARELRARCSSEVGEDPADILHVAFGFKYDIGPAKQLGLGTAWVNRHQEPLPDPGTVPDYEWRDLWGLAEAAAGAR